MKLLFTPSSDTVSAQVYFVFRGEESDRRRIRLVCTLLDSQGAVIIEGERVYSDQRIAARKPEKHGRFWSVPLSYNKARFRFAKDSLDRVAVARIRLWEI